MKIKKGLYFKFIIPIIFLMICVAVSISSFFIVYQKNLMLSSLIKRGVSLTKNLAYNSEYGVLISNKAMLNKLLGGILKEPDVVYSFIIDQKGNVLANFDEENKDTANPKEKNESISRDQPTALDVKFYPNNNLYRISMPIIFKKWKEEQSETVIFNESFKNEKNIVATETIGFAIIGLSLADMQISLVKTTKKIILITFSIISLGVIAAIFLIRAIVNPIRILTNEAKKIAKGNLNRHVQINSNDEIGELSSAFNQMVRDLKKSREELEDYNKSLEERVEERTKKLKAAQFQLIHSAKMAAIGQLGAGIAHELNNPLGGILGYAQYLINKINDPYFDFNQFKNCNRYLHHIETESIRCKKIVENLLSFSRKTTSLKGPIDVNKVIQFTLSILEHQLSLKKIKINCSLNATLRKILGDTNQLQQVFTNIIINAQHAMPDGGEITIISQNISDKYIEVSFSDTGVGITKENLDKIFEPFFTTKQDWKGTGLGLSISYEIIRDHQGNIEVTSELEKGTVFNIILPTETNHVPEKIT